jgi:hypothetical protein
MIGCTAEGKKKGTLTDATFWLTYAHKSVFQKQTQKSIYKKSK